MTRVKFFTGKDEKNQKFSNFQFPFEGILKWKLPPQNYLQNKAQKVSIILLIIKKYKHIRLEDTKFHKV